MKTLLILCLSGYFLVGSVWSQGLFSTESIRGKLFQKADKTKDQKQPQNFFEGVVTRIADSESIWVNIENKREFNRWVYKLSQSNLDIQRQEVRVWLSYVSPKRSISRGKKYNDWFKKKVRFELAKNFGRRRVRVDYHLLKAFHRMEGMVWAADTNLNIWLVRNGWSFYLIEQGNSPFHQDFVNAEKLAEQQQLGLWKPVQKKTKQG